MMIVKKVLFLCTGNSCRSQMAEGFAKTGLVKALKAYSAGLEPQGINPYAIKVMAEEGIDISGQTSNRLELACLEHVDAIVTLCGDAEERCPLTPPGVKRLHWPIADPAKATGAEREILDVFRKVRDEIKARVKKLPEELRD